MSKKVDINVPFGSEGKPTDKKPVKLVLSDKYINKMDKKYMQWYPVGRDSVKTFDGEWNWEDIPHSEIEDVITVGDIK